MFTDDKESASASNDGNPIMEIQWRPALRKRDARLGGFTRQRVLEVSAPIGLYDRSG